MTQPQSESMAVPAPPSRPDDAHKGTFGTVIIVGGSLGMMGAPGLCASAALRAGAGLVRIAASADVLSVAIGIEPGATGLVLCGNLSSDLTSLDQADPGQRSVLAIGPGLGCSSQAKALVMELLRGRRPIVLDADGLNLLAAIGQPRPPAGGTMIMTPHPGEFARLARPLGIDSDPTDPSDRPAAAKALALAHRAIVVLKGRHSVVTDGTRCYINQTGNPALATAGSGDVLTGVIAALMCQSMLPFDAAVLGVYLHGMAADLWQSEHGPSGLTARDLAALLPSAFHRHRLPREP